MRGRMVFLAASLAAIVGVEAAHATSTGRCGGTGGDRRVSLTCPAGEYVVGIGARGGAFVDRLFVRCQKLPVSGQPGARGTWRDGGATGGLDNRFAECPQGRAVTRVLVSSGGLVDKVSNFYCNAREPGSADWAPGFQQGNRPIFVDIGGIGGTACRLECPPGEALFRVDIRFGGFIDSLTGQCRR